MDWIAGHLYWVDSSWARIEAMDLDNLNRTEVIRTGPNTNPSAIAVDPLRRYRRCSYIDTHNTISTFTYIIFQIDTCFGVIWA